MAHKDDLALSLPSDMRTFHELQFVSMADIRKILSRRAHEKHKEKICQIRYDKDRRGECPESMTASIRVLPSVSENDVILVNNCWAYVVKFSKVEGPRLLTTFYDNHKNFYGHEPPKVNEVKGEVRGLVCRQALANQGAWLVDKVMNLLLNIDNEAAFLSLMKGYFSKLLDMGHTTKTLQAHKSTFLIHMRDTFGANWSLELLDAWTKLIDDVIVMWSRYLTTGKLADVP